QADSSLARSEGGLGVGLTLARHLVEMQDGALVARSEGRGRGSEFEVRLPLAARSEGASETAVPAAASPAGSPRILMIEDNRDAREMLRVLLELGGHHVDEARDGRTGIRMASASAPEVVLIDLGLPDLDGYEVARSIRKRLGSQVRLIALTGYSDPEARRRAVEAGVDHPLVKPGAPEPLTRALQLPPFPAARPPPPPLRPPPGSP